MSKKRLLGAFVSRSRLRAAFLLLGGVLLSGLAFLSLTVSERLKEARTEREEMVASRVFDELEREVSSFLEGEAARPRYASLLSTDPASWAPFVVGYFRRENGADDVVAADGITSENRRRIAWALNEARPQLEGQARVPAAVFETAPRGGGSAAGEFEVERKEVPSVAPAPVLPGTSALPKKSAEKPQAVGSSAPLLESKGKASGSDIIQQLNRAPERRKANKTSDENAEGSRAEDPFEDYGRAF